MYVYVTLLFYRNRSLKAKRKFTDQRIYESKDFIGISFLVKTDTRNRVKELTIFISRSSFVAACTHET